MRRAWLVVLLLGCSESVPFDATDPARGPGGLVGNGAPVSDGQFAGEGMAQPTAAKVAMLPAEGTQPTCNAACRSTCDGLGLDNPVDQAVCPALWGVGLETRPVVPAEACRRLFVDLVGRLPTRAEARASCDGKSWGQVSRALLARPEFVLLAQRRWADLLRYNNQAVSVERIFDMDRLVGKAYHGLLSFDELAAVMSAHPVLTRRHATPGDRAEALFNLLLGRVPYENERADLGRLYTLWDNGYYDHPGLGMRLPDATISYQCVGDDGMVDPAARGECTSVQWGFTELILTPDLRARRTRDGLTMWSGLLRPDEWQKLQAPGRVLTRNQLGFWEHAVDDVLRLYLGYDIGASIPAVREKLVAYVLQYNGDIRAAHHAVVTSQVYLQSASGMSPTTHRWTYGPLKQVEVEPWIDTIKATTSYALSNCDHRIADPKQFLESGSIAGVALVQASRWQLDGKGGIVTDYRNLARTLGGCPENTVGGRFKTISILTTATQEGFVRKVCNPAMGQGQGAAIAKLLPDGFDPKRALDADVAMQIADHQIGLFYGRDPSPDEQKDAAQSADACTPKPCTAETFARPLCYALLSGSEMLFY